jgi:hypothetical protein
MRGMGGGTSGNTSNSAVNSAKDGIRVVLALCNDEMSTRVAAIAGGSGYLTTEIAKSGTGGWSFYTVCLVYIR